jgi:hypothetical protein
VKIEQRVQEKIVFPANNAKNYTPMHKASFLTHSPVLRPSPHLVSQIGIEKEQNVNVNDHLPKEFPFSQWKENPNDIASLLGYLDTMKSIELNLFAENN